ncbi:ABC transporter substrate-binding protein [Kosmotoga arenicorallina S304]|uniref:ABC transporter substrate-binding protein n=1 Tax=Kosmotoga arenicorallina S304 TaxID=1453497 RepID=A0A182C7L2_9BACT|nr:transporter substrate-binding domain-containing protein [Kosmotoga arenicorallina]OAA31633.1 ABC transporter substrate-binding protein [Kosmotoga arenicorallina S304]
MRRVWLVVLLAIFAGLAFGNLIDDIRSRGVLRVGQDAGYMPLYGTDIDGNRIGLEVELLQRMADILGVELEFVVVNWDGIIPALMAGKFDIIWSGMTITPQRALRVNFSIPYLTVGQVIVYNTREFPQEPSYANIADQDLRIAVQLGTTGDEAARRLFPNANILTFDSMDEAAFQVASGRADIMVIDSIYARYVAKKYDVLSAGTEFLTREDLGVAVRRGDLEALHWINTYIRWLQTSGIVDELQQKWFVDYEPGL